METVREVKVAEGKLYRVREVADMAGLTPPAVYQNINDGRLKSEWVPGYKSKGTRIRGSELAEWLKKRQEKGKHDPWRESARKVVIDGRLLYERRLDGKIPMLRITELTGVSPATLSRLESVHGPVRVNWDTYNALFPIFGDLRPKGDQWNRG